PSLTIAAHADRLATRLLENAPAQRRAGGPAVTAPSATGAEPGGGSGSPGGAGQSGAGNVPAESVLTGNGSAGNGSAAYGPVSGDRGGSRGPSPAEPDRTSLWFTEEMKGEVAYGETEPRAGAKAEGRRPLSFRLTITADDTERFVRDPEHTASAEGWIDASGHGGRRAVEHGTFNLFVDPSPGGEGEDRRLMKYRLFYTDGDGNRRTLSGVKNVLHGPPTRIWPDTSTLYVRLLDGHVGEDEEDGAQIVGVGVLHIRLTDFARQLTTFRTSGPDGAESLLNFGRFFAGELWEVYGPDPV
ncbi:MAG: FAD-dependent oxidoreductase, partial [Spirillospora sp.]